MNLFFSAYTHSSHKLARGIRRLNVPPHLSFTAWLEMHCMALRPGRYSGTKKRVWLLFFFFFLSRIAFHGDYIYR